MTMTKAKTDPGEAIAEAIVPYTDEETGEERQLIFIEPAEYSFVVPQQHVQELIGYRSERPPFYNRFTYRPYNRAQKWNYFACGLAIGAAVIILLMVVKTLFIK